MNRKQYDTFIHSLRLLFSGKGSQIASLGSHIDKQMTQTNLWIMVLSYGSVILFKYLINQWIEPSISTNDLYSIVTKPSLLFLTPWITSWFVAKVGSVTNSSLNQEEIFGCLVVATIPIWILEVVTTLIPWLYFVWILGPYFGYIIYYLYQSKEHIAPQEKIRYTIATILLYLFVYFGTSLLFNMINLL
ncbi:hypothetical protein K5X82_17415 [Halosquirtibacter xylanolyticus]|uniref:hypothetical protein n=1 Tax=Halosquirtibacter xylanolyticus TaxID=3374599 RepID=UPI00374A7074|nr:hypothetical protein K5X82_17415 [Prolixibacteraceae bacterium]